MSLTPSDTLVRAALNAVQFSRDTHSRVYARLLHDLMIYTLCTKGTSR
jgi:hypothetical protein